MKRISVGRAFIVVSVIAVVAMASAAVAITLLLVGGGDDKPVVASTTTTTTTTVPPTFQSLFADSSPGVIRIEATVCGGSGGVGTGFLIASDLVATVAHVVRDAATISVRTATEVRVASVIGIDDERDLALLQVDTPFTGHIFDLTTTAAAVGTPIAAIGFPLGSGITMTQGSVSGVGRKINVSDVGLLSDLLQTDVPINFGNSGGPLVTVDGHVVGLAESVLVGAQSTAYAVTAATAAPLFDSWRSNPQAIKASTCENPLHPEGEASVTNQVSGTDGAAISAALTAYVNAINDGDYTTAWQELAPVLQANVSADDLARTESSTYIFGPTLVSVTSNPDGSAIAYFTFTSIQNSEKGPRPGEQCSNWALDYSMVRSGSRWLIAAAGSHAGAPTSAPCGGETGSD